MMGITVQHLHVGTYLLIAISCSGSYWTARWLKLSFDSWKTSEDKHCHDVFTPWLTVSLSTIAALSVFNSCLTTPRSVGVADTGPVVGVGPAHTYGVALQQPASRQLTYHVVDVLVTYLTVVNTFLLLFWTIVIVAARKCFVEAAAYGIHVSWTALLLALCIVALAQRPCSSWARQSAEDVPLLLPDDGSALPTQEEEEEDGEARDDTAVSGVWLQEEQYGDTLLLYDARCAICLCDFTASAPSGGATVLSCKHRYHTKCLAAWLSRANSCPQCRAQVMVQPAAINNNNNGNSRRHDGWQLSHISRFRFHALWSTYAHS